MKRESKCVCLVLAFHGSERSNLGISILKEASAYHFRYQIFNCPVL